MGEGAFRSHLRDWVSAAAATACIRDANLLEISDSPFPLGSFTLQSVGGGSAGEKER
jgi:hypothetical protein